jgi:hypothetical protein
MNKSASACVLHDDETDGAACNSVGVFLSR